MAHGASVVIGPDGFGAELGFDGIEAADDLVERLVPGYPLPAPLALRADAALRIKQTIGIVDALSIARHFLADHACRVGIVLGATHATDGVVVDDVDVQRAGGRA